MPGRFWVWLAASTLGQLGAQALAFATTWAAAASGAGSAAAVLTATVLPRVLLALTGGVVADRAGAWRVLVGGEAAVLGVVLALTAVTDRSGPTPAVLVAAALALGVADAFTLPAAGVLPRLLVPAAQLARVLSAQQLAGRLALSAGAPLGGGLVALAGLPAVALAQAAAVVAVLAVLLVLRPEATVPVAAGPDGRRAADGLRLVARDAVLRPAVLLTTAAAGFLLPVPALLVPLLARDRGWPASAAGLVVGAVAAGTVLVAGAVLALGGARRPGAAAPAGLLAAAAGVVALAAVPGVPGAVGCALLLGAGTGVFTTHVGPLVLGAAPPTHLARVQAVLLLAQSVPLLGATGLLGVLVTQLGPGAVVAGCGVAVAAAAGLATRSRALRGVRPAPSQPV